MNFNVEKLDLSKLNLPDPDVPCIVCTNPKTEKVGSLVHRVGGFEAWIKRKCNRCGTEFIPEEKG